MICELRLERRELDCADSESSTSCNTLVHACSPDTIAICYLFCFHVTVPDSRLR